MAYQTRQGPFVVDCKHAETIPEKLGLLAQFQKPKTNLAHYSILNVMTENPERSVVKTCFEALPSKDLIIVTKPFTLDTALSGITLSSR